METVESIARMVMPRQLFFFTAALWIALMPAAQDCMATNIQPRSEIKVNLGDGTLTVDISGMPLVDVLRAIAAEAGFKLMMVGTLESRITQHFTDIPIEKGIHRLVANRSVAVMYQIVDGPQNRKELQDIKEVWVFGSSEAVAENPDADTHQNSSKIDIETVSADDSSLSRISPSDAGAESPHEPEKLNPPPIAVGSKDAAAYPWFDPESDEGYWAEKLIGTANVAARQQAIIELQRIGSDAALAAIATVLGDDDVQMRCHAVASLGAVDNDNALQLLGQALLGDTDPSVRLEAVRSFANLNDEVSRAFLNTALKDNDQQVRALAKQALGDK